ncbi:MAG: hypothetical protein EOM51_01720 [Clostridia bacterium]|nr:hypothetical protein [Clostridia bacterium]
MTADDIILQLERDYLERLKWLVLREFRILPGSKAALEISDEDFIKCGAHIVLDRKMRSANCYTECGRNSSFEEERFSLLSEERL